MADVIQIVMEVLGEKNIESATKSTINLENRIKALDKSLKAGRISEEQFSTALKELRRALDKNGKSWQSNKADIERYVKELQASDAAAKAAIAAQEKLNQQRKLAETVLALQTQKERELAQQQKVAAQEAKAQAAEEERLKMKFVEGHAAMNLYSKELNDLAVARKLNVISAEQQKQKLAQLNKELETGTGRFSSYNLQTGLATKGNNRLGVVTQQAGYQVGDFLVQVQSGTNVMVAFGQQATQMVGTFAMLAKTTKGIAIFSALGVVIPIITAIGAALMRTAGAAKDTTKVFDDLKSAISSYSSITQDLKQSDFTEKFGAFAEYAERALRAMQGISQININEQISKILGGEVSRYERRDAGEMVDYISPSTTKAASKILGVGRTKEKDVQLITEYVTLLQDLQNARGFEAQAASADKLNKFLLQNVDLTKLEAAEREKVNSLLELTVQLSEQAGKANKDADAHIVEYIKQRIKLQEDVTSAIEAAGKKEVEYSNKVREDQIEILKLEGKSVEARRLAVKLAGEKAAQEVYSKFTNEELNRLTANQKALLAQAAAEASRNAEEAARTAIGLDDAKDKAKGLADNLRSAAATLASVANISSSLGATITSLTTEVNLLNKGESTGVAAFIARESEKINEGVRKLSKEGFSVELQASYRASQEKKLETAAGLLRQKEAKIEADREAAKKGSTADSLKSGTEYIERVLKPEIELRQKNVFLSDEQQKRAKFEFDLRQKLDKYKDKASEKEIAAVMALYDQTVRLERASRLIDYAQGQMEDFFMSVVDGTSTIEDAFKGMLRNILLEIYRQEIVKPMAEGISGFFKSFLFSAKGNVFQGGSQVKAFANGGVVSGPTMFPMTSGVGLMGEAGPEAIMPLKRGANGKLGVEMHGGGGDTINVVQNFSFSANGDESVKKIIAQAAPQIAQMTQQKIMDSRRRGGQMKATFS